MCLTLSLKFTQIFRRIIMEDLQNLKYKELQKLAKAAGIKANSPKAELISALESLKNVEKNDDDTPKNVNKSLRDNIDVEVQNKLNETFEKDNSTLNVTFDKEEDEENNLTNDSQKTLDQSEEGSKSRFAEFMDNDLEISFKRTTRSSTPVTDKRKSVASNKSITKTPKNDYLSKKCKTPLRKVLKTPGSIQKKSEKKVDSNIPRFMKGKAGKVPNFAKIHAKNSDKLESLDDYFEKKKKLTDTMKKQLDKAKALAEEHNSIVSQVKSRMSVKQFAPSVTSTAKMNLNFGGSASQTGSAPFQFNSKPVAAAPKTEKKERKDVKEVTKKAKPAAKKASARRNSDPKPLMNITNKSMNITNNKSVSEKSISKTPGKAKFDLAASLAKPLNYQPHKGKIQPLQKKKKTTTPQIAACSQEETKQRQMEVIKGVRLNKRAELLMMRRKVSN